MGLIDYHHHYNKIQTSAESNIDLNKIVTSTMISLLPLTNNERRKCLVDEEEPSSSSSSSSLVSSKTSPIRLQRRRSPLRKKTVSFRSNSKAVAAAVGGGDDWKLQPSKQMKEETIVNKNDEFYYVPLVSSKSSTSSRDNTRRRRDEMDHQHRFHLQRPLSTDKKSATTKDITENKNEKNKSRAFRKNLFVGRRIVRSVSLGEERPCMKKTRSMVLNDSPILRPYRQLSSEFTLNNINAVEEDIYDDDCESDCDSEIIPHNSEKTSPLSSQPPINKDNDSSRSFSMIVDCQKQHRQRPCMRKRKSYPTTMNLMSNGPPIMPLRKASIIDFSADYEAVDNE